MNRKLELLKSDKARQWDGGAVHTAYTWSGTKFRCEDYGTDIHLRYINDKDHITLMLSNSLEATQYLKILVPSEGMSKKYMAEKVMNRYLEENPTHKAWWYSGYGYIDLAFNLNREFLRWNYVSNTKFLYPISANKSEDRASPVAMWKTNGHGHVWLLEPVMSFKVVRVG